VNFPESLLTRDPMSPDSAPGEFAEYLVFFRKFQRIARIAYKVGFNKG
jgi:hypothetical protein